MDTCELCPTTTNAIERKNAEYKGSQPVPLKVALPNLYQLDKAVFQAYCMFQWYILNLPKQVSHIPSCRSNTSQGRTKKAIP